MEDANCLGRAAALKELAAKLARSIDTCCDDKLLPQLARQYRETIREMSELEIPEDEGIESLVGGLERVR